VNNALAQSALSLIAAADVFTSPHIALTAIITGVIAAAIGTWRITGRYRVTTIVAMAVISTAAVYFWRRSADLPQLNNDGLSGFSANDWLAPVITFVSLTLYRDLRPPPDPGRYNQARALTTIAAFAVNVITI
jgi:hypothetical protein